MKQHFHRELGELKTLVAKLGGLVEEAIGKALTSLSEGDKQLAQEVREGDHLIDKLEVEIEERCLKILALYHPVARDLRFIVSVLKVNNELEHMGDLAESIARKCKRLQAEHVSDSKLDIMNMGHKTQNMVRMALDALLKEDSERAMELIHLDDEVDDIHGSNHRIVAGYLEQGRQISLREISLLSVSRSLERIGDMATSIAEDVIYYVDAQIIRHAPRSD